MKTALLLMDIQEIVVGVFPPEVSEPYLKRVQALLKNARESNIAVLHVVIEDFSKTPIAKNKNAQNAQKFLQPLVYEGCWRIHNSLGPKEGEWIIEKKRASAFSCSSLDIVLRELEVDHLVLAGIATSGVVLSTIREAADKDFKITVVEDCCLDLDEEVHRVLMKKVFPNQAEVALQNQIKFN